MTRASSRQRGLTIIDVTVICVLVLLLVALALPFFAFQRRGGGTGSRMMQNSTQLRGIHQGMFTFAQSNKTGGRDGFYPGLDSRGLSIPIGDTLPSADLLASDDVPGYAADPLDHVLSGEMNTTQRQGFLTRAFAGLASGDFIPAGNASYFINPVDTVKRTYAADGTTPFTAANISYTVLDVSRHDGDAFPLMPEWKETINTQAIILADRAVGDGNDPATRSSVWTEPGSGEWRGSVCRNDGSTSFEASPGAPDWNLRYGDRRFAGGVIANLISATFALLPGEAPGDPERIASHSGVLYDEADSGTDPNAF